MIEGYCSGLDLSTPSRRATVVGAIGTGFANGRDGRAGKPRASAAVLTAEADAAMLTDDTHFGHAGRAMLRALSATRKRHAHQFANDQGTSFQNGERKPLQNEVEKEAVKTA
jgi:hypothetical protein